MSKKKHNSKTELFQELKEHLEELYNQMEAAEVSYNHLEHQDYVSLVMKPFDELIANVDVFLTNVDNGIYEPEDVEEDFEE